MRAELKDFVSVAHVETQFKVEIRFCKIDGISWSPLPKQEYMVSYLPLEFTWKDFTQGGGCDWPFKYEYSIIDPKG